MVYCIWQWYIYIYIYPHLYYCLHLTHFVNDDRLVWVYQCNTMKHKTVVCKIACQLARKGIRRRSYAKRACVGRHVLAFATCPARTHVHAHVGILCFYKLSYLYGILQTVNNSIGSSIRECRLEIIQSNHFLKHVRRNGPRLRHTLALFVGREKDSYFTTWHVE